MRTEAQIRLRLAELDAARAALLWALGEDGGSNRSQVAAEPMRRTTATELPPIAADVLSALVNLGCGSRGKAETATRAALAVADADGSATDFESIFRAALAILRPAKYA